MARALKSYTALYTKINKPRILQWAPTVGQVTLDVEFENGETREYTVSPLRAALLGYFGDDDSKTVGELVKLSGSSALHVRRAMDLWLDERVLREETKEGEERYVVVKDPTAEEASESAGGTGGGGMRVDEDEEDGADSLAQQRGDEALQMLESYVVGMIKNHKTLPLDRIHNMLKMFMQDPHPYGMS